MKFYKCLNPDCGIEFPQTRAGGKKFHNRDCYIAHFQKNGASGMAGLVPIVTRENDDPIDGARKRRKRSISGELLGELPVKLNVKTKPDAIPKPEPISENFNFDTLTIYEIKKELAKARTQSISDVKMDEIKTLLTKIIENLSAIENIPETTPPRRAAPNKHIPLRDCEYCRTSFQPEYEDEIFCCNECAQSRLNATKTGTLARPDATILSAGRSN